MAGVAGAAAGDAVTDSAKCDASMRGKPIPGLTGRGDATRRADLGREPSDVRGSVDAGADTSQPSLHAGAGGIYPSTAPPS